MVKRNYLVEGVSGTGKSAVCHELQKRGYKAINGDRELAYQGDPETGKRTGAYGHEYHIWDVDKVIEYRRIRKMRLPFSVAVQGTLLDL